MITALAESKTLGALDISSTTVKSVVELRNAVSLQELNVFDTHLCSIDVIFELSIKCRSSFNWIMLGACIESISTYTADQGVQQNM